MPFCELYGADNEINNENSLDNSGSNETAKGSSFASLVGFFSKKNGGIQNFEKLKICVFHPIWVKFD